MIECHGYFFPASFIGSLNFSVVNNTYAPKLRNLFNETWCKIRPQLKFIWIFFGKE